MVAQRISPAGRELAELDEQIREYKTWEKRYMILGMVVNAAAIIMVQPGRLWPLWGVPLAIACFIYAGNQGYHAERLRRQKVDIVDEALGGELLKPLKAAREAYIKFLAEQRGGELGPCSRILDGYRCYDPRKCKGRENH